MDSLPKNKMIVFPHRRGGAFLGGLDQLRDVSSQSISVPGIKPGKFLHLKQFMITKVVCKAILRALWSHGPSGSFVSVLSDLLAIWKHAKQRHGSSLGYEYKDRFMTQCLMIYHQFITHILMTNGSFRRRSGHD